MIKTSPKKVVLYQCRRDVLYFALVCREDNFCHALTIEADFAQMTGISGEYICDKRCVDILLVTSAVLQNVQEHWSET